MTAQVDYRFDLFAIYSSLDASWVNGYLLPALGLPDSRVMTVERFNPGETRLHEFERAVTDSHFTAVVLTPAFLGDQWAGRAQLLAAHLGVEERRNRLLPIVLRSCDLPLDLLSRVPLDYTEEADWESQTARLRELLDRPEPESEEVSCPYPGLVPYAEEDAALFCGRGGEIRELLRRTPYVRSVLVIGPSGSGKSSLVFAGFVPELRRREPNVWLIRPLRPGAKPVSRLQSALDRSPNDPHPWENPSTVVANLLSRHPPARRLLLVVDQLEEAFGQAPLPEREEFITAVQALRQVPACTAVLTMRADFYPELMQSQLWPLAETERLEVVPLRGTALRDAVEQPALQRGVLLEPALVERLTADAAKGPGVLTMLQETLRQLWGERRQRLLTLGAYEVLGREGASGMAVALATRADASLAELSPAERKVARRVFLRLVHLGEGRDDTRRQQSVTDLRVAGEDPALLDRTLTHLIGHRLLTAGNRVGEPDATVDLAHEALITGWPTLQEWVTEGREAELLRRGIERDAEEWTEAHRDRGLLYRGRRLKNAREWRTRYSTEPSASVVAFLAAGRRLDATVKTVAAVLVLLLGLGVVRLAAPVVREYQLRRAVLAASPMVPFPAGAALLGGLGASGPRAEQRRVLAAFSIDQHEVTNGQYGLCVAAHLCSRPVEPASFAGYERLDRDLPVVFLTAYQAADFCRWLGRRLPSGAEWERAARGTAGRPWPWGTDDPTPRRANIKFGNAMSGPWRVHDERFGAGKTPEGVLGLVGNVWEWTSTPETCEATPYDCQHLWNNRDKVDLLEVRGSSFLGGAEPLTFTDPLESIRADEELGFRCARTD
jgi:hypothetical protein